MLTKKEKKLIKNLMIVAVKNNGTWNVFEKAHDTSMVFTSAEAAFEYMKENVKEDEV